MMNKAKLICLTPVRNEAWCLRALFSSYMLRIYHVRNEAWCLRAFIETVSLWADHILILDQNSTDGSKEIALSYCKVILIDNPESSMHQSRASQLLFNEANKIEGKK